MSKEIIWRPLAEQDREAIMDYIAQDNPLAAADLDDEIETKVSALSQNPRLYKPGRIKGTREMVVRPNYVVVYQENKQSVEIIRVLHTAQQWPAP